MYVSIKLQFNQTRSGFSSIEIKCQRTRRNGLHQGAHVCSIRASISPCVGHISSVDSPKVMSVGLYRLSFAIFVVPPCSFFSICFPGTLQLQRLCWKIRQEANPPFRNRKARGTCTHALSGYSLNSRHFVFLVFFFHCNLCPRHLSFKILYWIPNLRFWTTELRPRAGTTELCS